ncbi:MAG: SdrD B-like domain-containing protein [Candidatus Latescibacterota bacterium]
MKLLFKSAAFAALLGILVFGCIKDEPLQAPDQPLSALVLSTAVSSEFLSPIDIPLATGSGIVAAGVGLVGDPAVVQPGTININVPGTVKQVILYWEGQMGGNYGDDAININGTPVLGTLIGGPTLFYPVAYSSTYRADITGMGAVSSGANSISVSGMNYTKCSGGECINNGAGIIVIYDDGSGISEIQINDGNDLCYFDFVNPLDRTEPQTFTFSSSGVPRTATLVMMASSVASNRPNIVRVTVNAVTTTFVDIFHNLDGPEFDTSEISVDVPAGATSLTVQCFSEKDPTSVLTGKAASLTWMATALSITPQELPGSLGDFVWEDMDADGIQDAGELGVAGVTVELYQGCGASSPVASTTTDANGNYLFSNLTPGDYFVKFILPGGWFFSPKDQGANDAKDSDANPTTGVAACTTIDAQETDLTWDAGIYQCADLGDYVWNDMNINGIQDTGEPGIAGVTVYLYKCGHTTATAITTTDANGEYFFNCLTPGSYFLMFDLKSGYNFTLQDQGADDALDSDPSPVTGKTVCTTLESNETDLTWDAGMWMIPTGSSCTPGYWKNHEEDWPATGYALTDEFDAVFGTDYFAPGVTLFQALWTGGGKLLRLGRHGTAALLNAAHPDVSYPLTVAEVIQAVRDQQTDMLADYNEDLPCNLPIKVRLDNF